MNDLIRRNDSLALEIGRCSCLPAARYTRTTNVALLARAHRKPHDWLPRRLSEAPPLPPDPHNPFQEMQRIRVDMGVVTAARRGVG